MDIVKLVLRIIIYIKGAPSSTTNCAGHPHNQPSRHSVVLSVAALHDITQVHQTPYYTSSSGVTTSSAKEPYAGQLAVFFLTLLCFTDHTTFLTLTLTKSCICQSTNQQQTTTTRWLALDLPVADQDGYLQVDLMKKAASRKMMIPNRQQIRNISLLLSMIASAAFLWQSEQMRCATLLVLLTSCWRETQVALAMSLRLKASCRASCALAAARFACFSSFQTTLRPSWARSGHGSSSHSTYWH